MYNIALIPGDGIGPEIIREGKKEAFYCWYYSWDYFDFYFYYLCCL